MTVVELRIRVYSWVREQLRGGDGSSHGRCSSLRTYPIIFHSRRIVVMCTLLLGGSFRIPNFTHTPKTAH